MWGLLWLYDWILVEYIAWFKRRLTCAAHVGWVIFKTKTISALEGPFLLLVMMSAMETPFGPKGRVTLTSKDDTLGYVDTVGGPKTAVEAKSWMNQCHDRIHLAWREVKSFHGWAWLFLLCAMGFNLSVMPHEWPLQYTLARYWTSWTDGVSAVRSQDRAVMFWHSSFIWNFSVASLLIKNKKRCSTVWSNCDSGTTGSCQCVCAGTKTKNIFGGELY